jgi:hypothetical protein
VTKKELPVPTYVRLTRDLLKKLRMTQIRDGYASFNDLVEEMLKRYERAK